MAIKKKASALSETSKKVGKALARSSHKVEQTGTKLKKTAQKLVKEATHKVEETVEEAVGKVKKEVGGLGKKMGSGQSGNGPYAPTPGMSVEGSIGFLAGDIYQYLSENGATPVEKLVKAIEKRKNSEALINAALGWLAREAKITFAKKGDSVSVL